MPFTLAHPAAVIPLARKRLVLSALVAGSKAPDFGKIFTLSPKNGFGHTWAGIFWFCIPTGLLALVLYHGLLKRPLLSLLPLSHQQRLFPWLDRFSFRPAGQFLWIVLSMVIGAT